MKEMEIRPIDVEVSGDPSGTALVKTEMLAPSNLFGAATAVQVVQKATEVATALKQVISQQGLISKISGREYPRCEAWTLCGTMLGVFPVLIWSKQLANGWEARVEAKTLGGSVVGAAEAQCLRTEKNWAGRDDFALRSMAQTRATAKALRMPLGFIMTLAGYEPTPAEEMAFTPDTKASVAPQPPPKTQPTPAPMAGEANSGSKAYVLKPAPTSEDWKQSFLKLAEERKMTFWAWLSFRYQGWLTSGQPLRSVPAHHIPTTRSGQTKMIDDLSTLMDAEIKTGGPDQEIRKEFDTAHAEDEIPGLESAKRPVLDSRPRVEGTIAHVSRSSGTKKNGEAWTRFGIKIGEGWFNTFSQTLGNRAVALKDQVVTLIYEEEERGNTAQELIWNDEITKAGEH